MIAPINNQGKFFFLKIFKQGLFYNCSNITPKILKKKKGKRENGCCATIISVDCLHLFKDKSLFLMQ